MLLLFSLRYENDNLIYQLKQKMRTAGMTDESLKLVDFMIEYAGKQQRGTELWQSQSFGAKAKRLFVSDDVENLLLAHKSAMNSLVQ